MKDITLADLQWLIPFGSKMEVSLYDKDLNLIDEWYGKFPIPGPRMGYIVTDVFALYHSVRKEPYLVIRCAEPRKDTSCPSTNDSEG